MRQVFTSIAALGMAAGAFGQQSIEDMAPDSSFLVVGIEDMATAQENLRGGLLWEMLESPEMKEIMEGALEQFHDMINMTEQELGLDEGELALPNGAVQAFGDPFKFDSHRIERVWRSPPTPHTHQD